jgi:anti-sigma factor RsiW
MGEPGSHLTEREMAELAALADGSLPAERRAHLEARLAESAELRKLLGRQLRALAATSALAEEPVPAPLRHAVEGRVRGGERPPTAARWRFAPRVALGGAAAALAAVVITLAVVLSGGPSGPSVADAARLAAQEPTGPAPGHSPQSATQLTARMDGATFPDLLRSFGWKPVGVRHDGLDGRNATTVYYAKNGHRIAYVIVGGAGLPRPTGPATTRRGVQFQALRVDGKLAITWRRLGHTCVLTGAAPRAELLRLASWRGGGSLRY